MNKNNNIYTIAKEAGVSPATVSRVLNKSVPVSEEKRKRVEAVINKYDYRPNALARGLIKTRTYTIGIIVSDLTNPYYSMLTTSCEKAIDNLGYVPMTCSTNNRHELEVKYLQKMYDMRMDAIILMGGKSDEMETDPDYAVLVDRISNTIPIVTTGKVEGARCYSISIDEGKATDLLMEYLVNLGHEKIAMVGGFQKYKSTYDKRICYKSAVKRYGLKYCEDYVIECDYTIEAGYSEIKKLIKKKEVDFPTAIIAINDFAAAGMIQALNELSISIPKDASIVSYDNTYIADILIPKVTGISYSYTEYGCAIVSSAVNVLEGESVEGKKLLQPKLIEKCSAGPVSVK